MTQPSHLETPLWIFASAKWHQPGMQALLLLLQEQYGFRVNLLLLACWAGSQKKCFMPDALLRIHTKTLHWHESTIKSLRTMRRGITESDDTATFRESLKKAEIDAEQLELLRLYESCHESNFDTKLELDEGPATIHNLLSVFKIASSNFHLDLLIQLSCIAVDSLDEGTAKAVLRSIEAP